MKPWTKKSALAELDSLLSEIEALKSHRRFSSEHTQWRLAVTTFLKEVFSDASSYCQAFESLCWQETSAFQIRSLDYNAYVESVHQKAYCQQLETARGILHAARNQLSRSTLEAVYDRKATGHEATGVLKVLNLAEFKLRKVVRKPPQKEVEVQDMFETLLTGADIPYSREADSIEYSTKTYKPDFTVQSLDLAIEIKLCADDTREKQLIPEINDDIVAYQTKYKNVLFVVYDVGKIRDIERFSKSFEANENVVVRIVKH